VSLFCDRGAAAERILEAHSEGMRPWGYYFLCHVRERGPSRQLDTSFGNFLAESLVSLLNAKTKFREVVEHDFSSLVQVQCW